MAAVRHFLALRPDAAARRALAATALPAGARPVAPEDLHLTLAFLGTLDPAGESAALAVAARVARPVTVRLNLLCGWTGPRVLCATTAAAEALEALAAELAQELRAAALPVDSRHFRAHVTLARHYVSRMPLEQGLPQAILWQADALVLMASTSDAAPRGSGLPRYVERGRVPLPAG